MASANDFGRFKMWAALLLALPLCFVGWWAIERTSLAQGDRDLTSSEVGVLPESAPQSLRDTAAACDAGKGGACLRLHYAWVSGQDGIGRNMTHARRLCRKACELGEAEACDQWQRGAATCPLGS